VTVYLVGAGPGDPGLLTMRGAELLRGADVVLYDRLSVEGLLDLAPASAERISVGKTPRGPSMPQDEINAMLIAYGRAGREVVRLKGGDPFVFARGGEEAAALLEAGVDFEVVPGISSAIAVPSYGGVPVTQRGLATSFTVVTGHEDPWAATETDWDAVARVGGTIVVLMGASTRGEIARRLIGAGLDAETPVVAVVWGTRSDQRSVRTTLSQLGEAAVDPPATIVIGAVAGLDLSWFERRPLFGKTVVVTRAEHQASALSTRLRTLGATVLELPTIRIEPIDADLVASLEAADWVVFTSTNAVERVGSVVRDARAFGHAQVAAVGPGTAAALSAMGIAADLTPTTSDGAGLATAFPSGPGRVFLPQSEAARPTLAEGLRSKGWTVDAVSAYRPVATELAPDRLEAAGMADAVAFTSSSAVTNFVAAIGAGAVPPVVVCIGASTAGAARAAGLEVASIAASPTIDDLATAVVSALTT
jgi:uroporphyrinogen III methyltransferase/synthase